MAPLFLYGSIIDTLLSLDALVDRFGEKIIINGDEWLRPSPGLASSISCVERDN